MAHLNIKDVLNKVYLRQKPLTVDFNLFCENLDILKKALEISNGKKESEEHIKIFIIKFLQDVFYAKTNLVNTKGNIDCAIYETLESNSPVQVIIEAKRWGNNEFPTQKNLNSKAMRETVYYYMRERELDKNIDLKHIVITDGFQWFVFDAADFEKYFYNNKDLYKHYIDFDVHRNLFLKTTTDFYNKIASPVIDRVKNDLNYVYFDIRNLTDQRKIEVYKLLSPQHLLRRFVCNDSNELNAPFYNELLYIIGLEEIDDGSKQKICRLKPADRKSASIIENAINQIEDTVSGEEHQFEIALSLSITWINRILFLKLLESQLVNYHKGDAAYRFLNTSFIYGFDELQRLFFKVLAVPTKDRKPDVAEKYRLIPYLNSSLFEMSEIEERFKISGLRDDMIPVHPKTVLYDSRNNKRLKGELKVLDYLFRFLDAYDFGSEPDDDSLTRDNRKSIINASVLGLIFEKINGYKDGSFFTPGAITQYMCRESLRSAVVKKFNEAKGWNCNTIEELADKDLDKIEANQIINSLRICDPAVGSGHFLVSALNELIAIKADLKVLLQTDGKRLKYGVSVENDELMIDDDGEPFVYNPKNAESQLVQESLFAEKRAIIENCLFGVDINPNSVNICRLRLWIELLKNAYYKQDGEFETLPNIDINIKCGNSIVSRFPVKIGSSVGSCDNLTTEIRNYKACVKSYKYENDKTEKQDVKKAIKKIKEKIVPNIQFKLELDASYVAENREAMGKNIYRNSMEWMIEFPEVLDDDGRFKGFDVVIGNPPYLSYYSNTGNTLSNEERLFYVNRYKTVIKEDDRINAMNLMTENGVNLLSKNGHLSFIVNKTLAVLPSYISTREYILNETKFDYYVSELSPFSAIVDCIIIGIDKQKMNGDYQARLVSSTLSGFKCFNVSQFRNNRLKEFIVNDNDAITRIESHSGRLGMYLQVNRGVNIGGCFDDFLSSYPKDNMYRKYLSGTANIKRYCYNWSEQDGYMKLDQNLEKKLKQEGKTIALGDPSRYNKERLIIPESSQTITAVYCNEDYYTAYGLMIGTLINEKYTLQFLCGLLNSKAITFYAIKKEILRKGNKATPHVGTKGLMAIPMPSDTCDQQPITNLVNQILTAKKQNLQANTESLEREIDMRVYKLYGLTLEEAQVIDASVTAEDFDKY